MDCLPLSRLRRRPQDSGYRSAQVELEWIARYPDSDTEHSRKSGLGESNRRAMSLDYDQWKDSVPWRLHPQTKRANSRVARFRKLKMARPNRTTFFAETSIRLNTAEAAFFVNEALFDATQEIVAFDALEAAKAMAPVLKEGTKERQPGELRDSLDARVRRLGGKKSGVSASITTSCGFGGYVELGTSKMTAEPFIWPAFEGVIQRLPAAVKANLETYTTGDSNSNG